MALTHSTQGIHDLVHSIANTWDHDVVESIDYDTGQAITATERLDVLDYLTGAAEDLLDSLRSYRASQ